MGNPWFALIVQLERTRQEWMEKELVDTPVAEWTRQGEERAEREFAEEKEAP